MGAMAPEAFLPYEKLMECTHCGLCLPYCPTYRELGVEMDSPRGRIYLVRALEDERVGATGRLPLHLGLCVGCRACETACPSGVSFGQILEHGRSLLGQRSSASGRLARLLYRRVLPKKDRILGLGRLLTLVQRSPMRRLMDALSSQGIMPEELRHSLEVLTVLPAIPQENFMDTYGAAGDRKITAGLLLCCVMRVLLTDVNEATIRMMIRGGCDVVIPPDQQCCGALHAHVGLLEEARRLAMVNIAAFEASGTDVVVTNSAGCGSHMKEYPRLFRGSDGWEQRAQSFSEKVRDISELLHSLGLNHPPSELPMKVAYDDPCHLLHGQGIGDEPRDLLEGIPGLELVALKEPDWCCGSAGTYMFTEREMALRLLDRKLEDIAASGADIIATGNPGCLLWLAWGMKRKGVSASCVHPVQLLDMAYGQD